MPSNSATIQGVRFGIAFLLLAAASSAATISVAPDTQNVPLGNTAVVGLFVSGLGDGVAPSLSSFSLDLSFDDSLLSLTTVNFGDPSATPNNQIEIVFPGISGFFPSVGSSFTIFQSSFDLPADLISSQHAAFRLFSVEFATLGEGVSMIEILNLTATDEQSNDFSSSFAIQTGAVEVTGAGVVIPEPATWSLLAGALALLAMHRRVRTGN